MSKGKRKSDPEAVRMVQARLRGRGEAGDASSVPFSPHDRDLLLRLCRVDLIHLIEVQLGLGPLKVSHKNSVVTLVDWLLRARRERIAQEQAQLRQLQQQARQQESVEMQQQGLPAQLACHPPAGAQAGPSVLGALPRSPELQDDDTSSKDGSCHTPHNEGAAQDEDTTTPAAATKPAAAPRPQLATPPAPGSGEPVWLQQLQQQLEQAGDAPADIDEEVDSAWVACPPLTPQQLQPPPLQQQPQQPQADLVFQEPAAAPQGTSHAAAAGGMPLARQGTWDEAACMHQIEEALVSQLLLDIECKPPGSRRHSRQSMMTQQQQPATTTATAAAAATAATVGWQQQCQQPEAQRDATLAALLLQQQQQQLQAAQQQTMQQIMLLQTELELQKQQQEQQQREQLWRNAAMQQQLLQELELEPSAPSTRQQSWSQQQPQPPQQQDWPTWPLPHAAAPSSAAAAWPAAVKQEQPAYGQSDAALFNSSWQPRSCELSGSSFLKKRDMTACRDVSQPLARRQSTGADALAMYVELSGPSADLPTKRMSLTLPDSAAVASVPTSFSGRLPASLAAGAESAQAGAAAAAWPQDALCAQQQQPSGVAGLAQRLGGFLRSSKAKAKRHASKISAGSAAGPSGAAGLPAGWAVPSGAAGQPLGSAAAGPQLLPPSQAAQPDNSFLQPPAARGSGQPDARWWSSMVDVPADRTDSLAQWQAQMPASVGGLSWHAGPGTCAGAAPRDPSQLFAGATTSHRSAPDVSAPAAGAAGFPHAGPATGHAGLARQLAHLRALYGDADEQSAALRSGQQAPCAGAPDAYLQAYGGPAGAGMAPLAADKAGLMRKLAGAFKRQPDECGGMRDAAPGVPAAAGGAVDDLMLTRRCDGALDLSGAAGWQLRRQASPPMGVAAAAAAPVPAADAGAHSPDFVEAILLPDSGL